MPFDTTFGQSLLIPENLSAHGGESTPQLLTKILHAVQASGGPGSHPIITFTGKVSENVRTDKGFIMEATLTNQSGADLWLMLFPDLTSVSNGTVPDVPPLLAADKAQSFLRPLNGIYFETGISVHASTTGGSLTKYTGNNCWILTSFYMLV